MLNAFSRATDKVGWRQFVYLGLCVAFTVAFCPNETLAADWSCNAYGYGGGKRKTWQTFASRAATRQAAAWSAIDTCERAGFIGCRASGCWLQVRKTSAQRHRLS